MNLAILAVTTAAVGALPAPDEPVSYYQHVRPVFQAKCQGCHQPAKAKGGYVMTEFEKLVGGGETGPAIVPGAPDESYLVEEITPDADGFAEMPKKKDALPAPEIALIRRWIEEGAVDDTPENARERFGPDNPPVYTVPPVVTALDYSPDGSLIAVSGFHEVVLHRADGSGIVNRLIGLSARIESVAFSPDGTRLAVTGGLPARMGEVQIWDVAEGELEVSYPVTFDTLYGASWSPDGKLVAFGAADTGVRAIEADSGREVLFNAAHDDWALDTVFSKDGSHVVSVGRDMTAKLFEVATQRFVDNITSITPGALKGGIQAIDRHPDRDEVLVGGADGVPQIYRLFRIAKRVIGDNSNLVRRLPPMEGRIFAVAFSPDGTRAAAGSSLDGRGRVQLYETVYDGTADDELKAIFGKQPGQRSAEETARVEAFQTDGVTLAGTLEVPESAVYSVAWSPDGGTLAVGGADGKVRLVDAGSLEVREAFIPVRIPSHAPETVAGLEVSPESVELRNPFEKAQLVVTARLADGSSADVTREVDFLGARELVAVSATGLVESLDEDGEGALVVRYGDCRVEVPVTVRRQAEAFVPDYVRDVNPVITRLGCNAGTCHGAKDGKNGFKLSLRGYDSVFDLRAFTDDHAARRVNFASPRNSLMLLKATGAVPHEGGQLTRVGEDEYEILEAWIAAGAEVDPQSPKVASIAIHPENPVVADAGDLQQMRVVATFADGSTRDVTGHAFLESGNTEVATSGEGGLVTALRRGEAPVLARYEGAYAATTVTVMGDREGFEWAEPELWTEIDRLVAAKWERTRTLPSGLCSDETFVRRVHLDLTGLPPTPEEVRAFLADGRPTREKRDALIDALIGSEPFVDHWTNKWADLLQVNRKFLGPEGAAGFRDWIREQVAANTPYDQFARAILTAEGSNRVSPAASYYKVLRTPEDIMENTTHLFLATRFNCNKCHDHPFERWTQDQYYEMTAFFARVGLERDPESGDRNIGGTAVEGAKPLYEAVVDRGEGETVHERTGVVTPPEFPYEAEFAAEDGASRRQRLAAWITSPDNRYFASSFANRVWGYLLGTGIIEPLDDIRAGNPPTNPELLDWLTRRFIDSGFDVRDLMREICRSRVYHLSVATNEWNEDDTVNFSHAVPKRLPAEVLYDTLHAAVGSAPEIPGVPAGTRAAELPDVGVTLPDGFLGNLGRPVRESACECERSDDLQLGAVMAMLSGPTVGNAISDPENALADLAASEIDDRALVGEIFMRVLNREARPAEIEAALATLEGMDGEHAALEAELAAWEEEVRPREEARAREREEGIASAKEALAAYQAEIAPREEEAERKQAEEVARLEGELVAYQESLEPQVEAWARDQAESTGWFPLGIAGFTATTGATAEILEDGSAFVSGANGKGEYRFQAAVDVERPITGIQLELIPDDRLPMKGPGRAASGNLVLTEIELAASPAAGGADPQPARFRRAVADHSQENFDAATAIDGDQKAATNNGWAIHPKVGERRLAVLELAEPVRHEGGTRLDFTFWQHYQDGTHSVGRFRVWATTSLRPLGFGLPQHVADALAVAADERSDEQRAAIRQLYYENDPGWQERKAALEEARKPRPEDPRLGELREALATAEQPLAVDPKLARLRREAELSRAQLGDRRLILAQDLAWALVNTPAFLFNH